MKIQSKSGVPVHTDYKENIVVDPDNRVLAWKASKDRFPPGQFGPEIEKDYPGGLPRIGSEHSEDALSWNLFRSLHLAQKLALVGDFAAPQVDFHAVYFWGRAANLLSEQIDPEIQDILDEMEPWGKNGAGQQTETDVILRGKAHTIIIECKLGKPGEAVKAWCRSSEGMRPEYGEFLGKLQGQGTSLFSDSFDYDKDANRVCQLFRNYVLGAALSKKWNAEFSLVAIVNSLNRNLHGRSHGEEFCFFRSLLRDPSNAFLITWQQIWDRVCTEPELGALRTWLSNQPLLRLPAV